MTDTSREAFHVATAANALKAGAGGPVAAAGFIWEQKDTLAKGLAGFSFLLLLPVLILCMLPAFLFNGYQSADAMNDSSVVMRNLQTYQMSVWSALDDAHRSVLDEIQTEIDDLPEDKKGVIQDDFSIGNVDIMLLLSQYSVSVGLDEISSESIASMIQSHGSQLFSYSVKSSGDKVTYTVHYAGDDYFADKIFHLTEAEKELARAYAANLQIFMYGSNMGGVTAQVSEKVLQYSGLVAKYADKYGISGFVDVIYAVMMAESGGSVPDVMQASECPYNTKYPKKPNSITDPEYSIEVGVHYLADCLKGAGCSSPNQTEKLSLALQGYNYGNGYISWAKENYGGYSESNAQIFSKMMQKKLGWSGYGNPKYVNAVFKYLLFSAGGTGGSPFAGKNWQSAISSPFGHRTDPLNGKKAFHEGLDIAYPTGTPINAIMGGTVSSVVFSKTGYGHHVRVDCGNGVQVLYAHCSNVLVTKGQSIAAGQIIAEVGATGRVTGPHLHLGVLVNGKEVDPMGYISP